LFSFPQTLATRKINAYTLAQKRTAMTKTQASPYNITFLLDNSNNWIESHLHQSNKFLNNEKFNFKISHNHSDINGQDIVFILGYTKILDNEFLGRNTLNVVVHESDLPQGKGFAPVQWQILEGKNSIPICLLEASENVDAGDILFRSTIEFNGSELYDEIRLGQANATFISIESFLINYPNFKRIKQEGSESFFKKRGKKDGQLDINKSIIEQFNLLRIGNNEGWPSHFQIEGQSYILKIYKDDK
jgi:methionyl-tRNA formyltransferase